jgi:hypothetical protein
MFKSQKKFMFVSFPEIKTLVKLVLNEELLG